MCRYGMMPYKEHYACFGCRKSFKQPFARNVAGRAKADDYIALCPQCAAPMPALGLDFKAPAQRNVRQWRKVARLFEVGIIFSSCGCSGPGSRPATLGEVDFFLAERSQPDLAPALTERRERGERKWRKAKKDLAAKRMRKLIAAQGQEL